MRQNRLSVPTLYYLKHLTREQSGLYFNMTSSEHLEGFSKVIDHSKEFKTIASYFLVTESPVLEDLNKYVRKECGNSEFLLHDYLNNYVPINDGNENFENLIHFFKFFNIEMEEFIHNKMGKSLFEYLKKNEGSLRIYRDPSNFDSYTTVKFTSNYTRIYFYDLAGYYHRLELNHFSNRCNLFNRILLEIVRIEKVFGDEWLPVLINENGKFLKLDLFES